jgi:dTDP-4-dehydrorhamnose reductase
MEIIWVTGAGGLIGSYLVRTAPEGSRSFRALALTRQNLDLCDFYAVERRFRQERPTRVLHCGALSRSPACEANPTLARQVNAAATAHLAELCGGRGLVLLSTDLVFDGKTGNYPETAPVNPLNIYGETKVEAEQTTLRGGGNLVIRTSLNAGVSPTANRGFNEEIRLAWRAGRELCLFTDEFRSPIGAEVTARAIWALVLGGAQGLYHVAGAERLSRWQLGERLAARWPELNPRLRPGSLQNYHGPSRAPDTTLQCAKAQALLPFPLPKFSAWLEAQPRGALEEIEP